MHSMNHPASSTPAVDEKHVYVYFGTYGLICYDHKGNTVWYRIIKTPNNEYGMATSPILYKNNVILVLDDDSRASRLLAVNQDTGETVWQQPRLSFRASWSTPMIWCHDDTEELIVLGSQQLTSYNPSTGKEIWWAGGFPGGKIGVSIAGEGLIFSSAALSYGRGDETFDVSRMWKIILEGFDKNQDKQIQRDEMMEDFEIPMRPDLPRDNPGYGLFGTGEKLDKDSLDNLLKEFDRNKDGNISEDDFNKTLSDYSTGSQPTLLAIRSGAKNNARESYIAWEIHRGIPEVPSLLFYRGKLYLIRNGGVLTCLEAATGKELFQEKIGAFGQYIASPVAAGDKVLFSSVPGVVTVIQVEDKLKIISRKDFGEEIYATPAVIDNKLYIRTAKHMYAIGE
jgi:outer membrane protein assembly factor BamB